MIDRETDSRTHRIPASWGAFLVGLVFLATISLLTAGVVYPEPDDRVKSPGDTSYFIDPANGDDANTGLSVIARGGVSIQ